MKARPGRKLMYDINYGARGQKKQEIEVMYHSRVVPPSDKPEFHNRVYWHDKDGHRRFADVPLEALRRAVRAALSSFT